MMSKMTPQAQAFWDSISARNQTLILNNVWCGSCRTSRTLVRYGGRIEHRDLILEGECGSCGAQAGRLVEGS